uniref:Uncharacterized protein n=1 Tax=Anguilla anguilla TaxID=7936 RepID=A0A0E9QZC0_ANGAN
MHTHVFKVLFLLVFSIFSHLEWPVIIMSLSH